MKTIIVPFAETQGSSGYHPHSQGTEGGKVRNGKRLFPCNRAIC